MDGDTVTNTAAAATQATTLGSGQITVVLIMLLCGGLGGFAAWVLAPERDGEPENIRYKWFGYVVVGMIVSLAVPLFLSMAQSDLIGKDGAFAEAKNGFIFAGFCIVAGFSARAFMTTISEKVLREMQQEVVELRHTAAEAREDVEELRDNVQVPVGSGAGATAAAGAGKPPAPAVAPEVAAETADALNDEQKKVLRAAGTLTMRTTSGIAKDASLPRPAASKVVEELIAKGLAERTTSPTTGDPRFRVTPVGSSVLNAIDRK
ncbi:YEATS-associated helix-containing protein [Roseibium sp.]|uniref:YEATS-associated helix-containing protein n=1 Tax=Roseibium sp. TaxID=1936156 RepID=UPI003A985EFF